MKTDVTDSVNSHGALVRGDDGNLAMRRFASAGDATRAALDRELPVSPSLLPPVSPSSADGTAWNRRMLKHDVFAKRIGAPSQLVRAAFRRGGLPGSVMHSKRLLLIPAALVDACRVHGLLGLERRVKSGTLIG